MSPQENQVLSQFLDQLVKVQGINKDAQASALISDAVSKQPDAAYLLVQRALLLDQAMANANSQIASLQAEIHELKALNAAISNTNSNTGSSANNTNNTSFLDPAISGWGNSASSRPLNIAPSATTSVTGTPLPSYGNTYNTSPSQTSTAFAAQPAAQLAPSGFFGGNTGNVLGTVAATAAGVAAGAFLYQGINSMMGHGSHHNATDGAASNLNSSDGGLLPGYFDQDQTALSDNMTDDTDII
ncbi:DUF2076 domain-containing protein [Undibacterium sp. SXout7W]|uniref:DUF2076 domain-containing protein n=1 Tax=Undibacterium sp. SXout7W TaxID=3413049 RepID=UPI003BF43352